MKQSLCAKIDPFSLSLFATLILFCKDFDIFATDRQVKGKEERESIDVMAVSVSDQETTKTSFL